MDDTASPHGVTGDASDAGQADSQADVRAFLADPATYGGAAVEVMETHISLLLLAGDRVFKLKRALRLPYCDFTTSERRLAICELAVARRRTRTRRDRRRDPAPPAHPAPGSFPALTVTSGDRLSHELRPVDP